MRHVQMAQSGKIQKMSRLAPFELIICPQTWFFTADRLEMVPESSGLKKGVFLSKNWESDFNDILRCQYFSYIFFEFQIFKVNFKGAL